jgi:hypothetical protein
LYRDTPGGLEYYTCDLSHLVVVLHRERIPSRIETCHLESLTYQPALSWVSPIVSTRATIYIEMEKLIQNENLIESGKKFIFNL